MTERSATTDSGRSKELIARIRDCVPPRVEHIDAGGKTLAIEKDPWGAKYVRMIGSQSDAERLRSSDELESEGLAFEHNEYVAGERRFLPVYESHMVHQYNHRQQLWLSMRQAEVVRAMSPNLLQVPRRWVDARFVVQQVADFPDGIARQYFAGHEKHVARMLAYWLAGYCLNRGDEDAGHRILRGLVSPWMSMHEALTNWLGTKSGEDRQPLATEEVEAMSGLPGWMDWAEYLIRRRTPDWLVAFRTDGSRADKRTLACAAIPLAGTGEGLCTMLIPRHTAAEAAYLLASLNAFVLDFVAREGTETRNAYEAVRKLPIRSPAEIPEEHSTFVRPRVLELVYTASDVKPFARGAGYDGPAFSWDEERRFLIRCELDAACFHLYDIERDDVNYIMETFPIVKREDEAARGHYRTKDTILEIYDAMAEAIKTGKPYQTCLDPPPGPPTNPDGTFATLPEWKPDQLRPPNWPAHIHPPREVMGCEQTHNQPPEVSR